MTTTSSISDSRGHQDRTPFPAGQDEVENGDHFDNLEDADTLADLNGLEPNAGPPLNPVGKDDDEDAPTLDDQLDDQPDGDRQLTTDSEAIDTGLNDSDLGAEAAGLTPHNQGESDREGYAGLGPDAPVSGGDQTGDRATGLMGLRG